MRAAERHRWKAPLVAAIAAVGLIGAGCGDSDDETTETAGDAQSKADFIAAADAICVDSGAELNIEAEKVFGGANGSPSTRELKAFFSQQTLPTLQEQIDEIAALPPPEGEEEAVQAIVDAGNEAIAESEADVDLLLVPQGEATPFDQVNQLARDFGLKVCGGAEAPAGQPAG